MDNDQQPAAEVAAEGNVMEKVLGTFDGIVVSTHCRANFGLRFTDGEAGSGCMSSALRK